MDFRQDRDVARISFTHRITLVSRQALGMLVIVIIMLLLTQKLLTVGTALTRPGQW